MRVYTEASGVISRVIERGARVRFLTVLLLVIAAAALGGTALRDGSLVLAIAAGACALLAIVVLSRGGAKRRAKEAASASLASSVASPSIAAESPAAPPVSTSMAESAPAAPEVIVGSVVVDEAMKEDVPGDPAEGQPSQVTAMEPTPDMAEVGPESVPMMAAGAVGPETAADESDVSGIPSVRTPFSVQPAVVLMSFYDAIAERFDTLSAHLWLEDTPTATLRLVAAFGPRVPGSDPVPLTDPILGSSATTRTAVFRPLDDVDSLESLEGAWRYAVPVGTPEVRGIAAVDVVVADPAPAAVVLNEVSAVLRGSLTAALAVHVARSEMDTAVLLLQAAQQLTSGIAGEEVLSAALESAMLVAGASTGSVMVPDGVDGPLRIVASHGLSADVIATTSVDGGEGIAGTVYVSSSPLLIEDLPGRSGLRRHGVLSSVSVPIADDKGSFGVINVGARAFPARLTDAYVRALAILGTQTAVAMRNATAAEQSWDLYLENLQALATALESDDPYRRGASRRTAVLSAALAEEMGLEAEDVVSLRVAAILHDVGMGLATGSVGAIDRPLSTVDRGLVRAHPKVASDVLQRVPSLERLAPMVRHHHERFDGDGYDTGLSGASIPMGSRILAVTDAFVAMTSPRPYRDALTLGEALEELDRGAGGQFDPSVVEAFSELLARDPELALLD